MSAAQTSSSNPLTAISDAMAEAVARAGSATVLVSARRRFPASGIVYASDLVLTADHVIEREDDITVKTGDGTEISATLAGRDPGTDLAVLRLSRSVASTAQPAAAEARIGQFVLAVGRPTSEGLQASLGVISSIGGPMRTHRGGLLERYLATDAVPYPGFSGGPLVDGRAGGWSKHIRPGVWHFSGYPCQPGLGNCGCSGSEWARAPRLPGHPQPAG